MKTLNEGFDTLLRNVIQESIDNPDFDLSEVWDDMVDDGDEATLDYEPEYVDMNYPYDESEYDYSTQQRLRNELKSGYDTSYDYPDDENAIDVMDDYAQYYEPDYEDRNYNRLYHSDDVEDESLDEGIKDKLNTLKKNRNGKTVDVEYEDEKGQTCTDSHQLSGYNNPEKKAMKISKKDNPNGKNFRVKSSTYDESLKESSCGKNKKKDNDIKVESCHKVEEDVVADGEKWKQGKDIYDFERRSRNDQNSILKKGKKWYTGEGTIEGKKRAKEIRDFGTGNGGFYDAEDYYKDNLSNHYTPDRREHDHKEDPGKVVSEGCGKKVKKNS